MPASSRKGSVNKRLDFGAQVKKQRLSPSQAPIEDYIESDPTFQNIRKKGDPFVFNPAKSKVLTAVCRLKACFVVEHYITSTAKHGNAYHFQRNGICRDLMVNTPRKLRTSDYSLPWHELQGSAMGLLDLGAGAGTWAENDRDSPQCEVAEMLKVGIGIRNNKL